MTLPHANDPNKTSNTDPDGDTFGEFLSAPMAPKTYAGLDLSILPAGAKIPNPRTIEGRQIRDLRDLRDFVDACIDAEGNVKLNVPYDMRLLSKKLSNGNHIYDLEITRW